MVTGGLQSQSGAGSIPATSTTHKPLLRRLYVFLYHDNGTDVKYVSENKHLGTIYRNIDELIDCYIRGPPKET
jgi:hypothetical protein